MKRFSIVGIIVGGIVDVVSSAIAGVPLLIVALALHEPARSGTAVDIASITHPNFSLTIAQWLVGGVCSVLGGYVAARIAKHDEVLNGTCSAWLCTLSGLLFFNVGRTPILQHVILLAASPLLGAAGGYLCARLKRPAAPLAIA